MRGEVRAGLGNHLDEDDGLNKTISNTRGAGHKPIRAKRGSMKDSIDLLSVWLWGDTSILPPPAPPSSLLSIVIVAPTNPNLSASAQPAAAGGGCAVTAPVSSLDDWNLNVNDKSLKRHTQIFYRICY